VESRNNRKKEKEKKEKMKKRKLALLGFAALAGVALASCGGNNGGNTNAGTGAGTTATPHVYGSDDEGSNNKYMHLSEASKSYNVNGDIDLWLVYSKSYGSTYNNVVTNGKTTNPIDGITYKEGDLLPAWKEFKSKLGITEIKQGATYGADDATNYTNFKAAKSDKGKYLDKNGNLVDLFYNTTTSLNELGDAEEVVDLTKYIENGKMPALKQYLDNNPAVKQEITHNNKIFYTPYLDGYQAIERMYIMDTTQVAKLFDTELPAGTGQLVAGAGAAADSKGLKGAPNVQPFLNADFNYAADQTVQIVNPKTNEKVNVTVKKTTNILKQQNELLATTDGSCTGAALIQQFKDYAQAAYGDIISTYYDGKISSLFTSIGACYNADDMIALLRIFKACPDVLFESATAYDEVVPLFPRGQANNRVENILNFAATLYGVQGRGSEYDHLFFGADGKIHDFDTAQASYDMLDKLHAMYSEGLIQENFWSGVTGTAGLDAYFKHSTEAKEETKDGKMSKKTFGSTFGLIEYDYTATQSAANDIVGGVGTKSSSRKKASCGYDFSTKAVQGVASILSPLTMVSTESYAWDQALDDMTGKTLVRYYEENRSVKNTSWSIPSASDNIDTAIALMDFMFTQEGWHIQNFGPASYWDYGTILGEEKTPVIKEAILNHFAETGLDFWNYCRGFLGTTQGIGHYRPTTLDYQATNNYSKDMYTKLTLAADLGVQLNSRAVAKKSEITWKASMPMAVFSTMDTQISNKYIGVTTFWAQNGKANAAGTAVGWVKIVQNGSSTTDNVLTNVGGKNYSYADILNTTTTGERYIKNTEYLAEMGKAMGLAAHETIKK
jgi:hypothetical protein